MLRSIQSDERLAEQASRGDQAALAAIFSRYHPDLFRYCVALLGNAEDAADALQNTMVKVLGGLPGERRKIQLKPWLYRIAHNESIELMRKRRELEPIEPDALIGDAGPESSAETRERLRQLIIDLRELPERQRGALVMRELGGLSFEQIGSAFETSAAVARQTVYEARLGLREMERGREMGCDELRRKLSDGDRRAFRRRDVRAHLRCCSECREFEAEIAGRHSDLAAISPLPALAAAALLKGALGGGAGSAGAAAGAASSAISSSVAVKAVATVAVAGAIGVGADRAGVVRVFGEESGAGHPAAARDSHPSASDAGATTTQTADEAGTKTGKGGVGDRTGADRALAPSKASEKEHDGPRQAPNQSAATADSGGQPSKAHSKSGKKPANATGQGAGSANAHGANPKAKGGNHGVAALKPEGKPPAGKDKQEGQAEPHKAGSSKGNSANAGTKAEPPPPGQSGEAQGKSDQAATHGKPDG